MVIRARTPTPSLSTAILSGSTQPKPAEVSPTTALEQMPASAEPASDAVLHTADASGRHIVMLDEVTESLFERAALNIDPELDRKNPYEARHLRSILKQLEQRRGEKQEELDNGIANAAEASTHSPSLASSDNNCTTNRSGDAASANDESSAPVDAPTVSARAEKDYMQYVFSAADDLLIHKLIRRAMSTRAFERYIGPINPYKNLYELLCSPEFMPNMYAGTTLAPNAGATVVENGTRLFNLYRGPGFPPVRGDMALFDGFVRHLFDGCAAQGERLLDILSWTVKNPGERLRFLSVFNTSSMENVVLLSYVMEVLNGADNTVYSDSQMLAYPHNDWLLRATLILVQRLSPSRPAMEKLSSLLNAPQQWINPKRADQFPIKTAANVVAFTQKLDTLSTYPHPGQIALITMNERALDARRSAEFRQWFDQGGKTHVLEKLLKRDLSRFTHLTPPAALLMTSAQTAMTISPVEDYLREAYDAGIAPMACDLVNLNRIVDYLNQEKSLRTTANEVRNALINMGATSLGQKRINNKKPNIWAIRNHGQWAIASEAGIASAYTDPFLQDKKKMPDVDSTPKGPEPGSGFRSTAIQPIRRQPPSPREADVLNDRPNF